MRLTKVQVTNFRCVNDTGEFRVGPLTCLVGKNESGKTTVLQALAGSKPYDNDSKLKYDKLRDYPRRYLGRYDQRHPGGDANVVAATWELDAADIAAVEEVIGAGCMGRNTVVTSRGYGAQVSSWGLEVDQGRVIANLADRAGCTAEDRKALKGAARTSALFATLEGKGTAISAGLATLKGFIGKFRERRSVLAVIDVLSPRMPGFLYFSQYDRMKGDVSLEALKQAVQGDTLTAEDKVFLAFLEFAGTTVDELAGATRFEDLRAQVESASIAITEQIFEYWSQNQHLRVDFDVTAGKAEDPPPLNTGNVMRARIRNELHQMSVPFNDRSAGFIWFFSFLVLFSQVSQKHDNIVILLDEPGLNLHAKAQADLVRYIRDKLLPKHQVIYTTHSPFMVPADDLASIRTVEDVVVDRGRGRPESQGTKVGDDVLSTDRDTLFPLQGALGYEITQSLFVGEHTLLVEGPAEILYLQVASAELNARGRQGLDRRWTLCPANGVDKVQAFLSLFGGNKLHVAVLLDFAEGQKGKVDRLRKSQLLRDGHVLTVSDFCDKDEADIEDMFAPDLFATIVNRTHGLTATKALTGAMLSAANGGQSGRLVKKAEAVVNPLIPADANEFSHYLPSLWLLQHPEAVTGDSAAVLETLNRFERLFRAVNGLLRQ